MDDDVKRFREEILQRIRSHIQLYEKDVHRDYRKSQAIAWFALLASFVGTVWTATGYLAGNQMVKIVLSVIVAIPGLMVAVESGFQYSTRVKMNTDAIYTLYDFIGRLGQGDDPFAVSKDFNAYMRRYGRDFPSGSASPRLNIATTGKGPGTAAR